MDTVEIVQTICLVWITICAVLIAVNSFFK